MDPERYDHRQMDILKLKPKCQVSRKKILFKYINRFLGELKKNKPSHYDICNLTAEVQAVSNHNVINQHKNLYPSAFWLIYPHVQASSK